MGNDINLVKTRVLKVGCCLVCVGVAVDARVRAEERFAVGQLHALQPHELTPSEQRNTHTHLMRRRKKI